MAEKYPLCWPPSWPRARQQRPAPFKVSPSQAQKEMLDEVRRLGGTQIIVSTNQPINRDGSVSMARRSIYDVGVAVYFKRKGKDVVLACDQYDQLHDNMRAIGKTAEAMRGIERWGASDMLDRAFTGFEALPAPEQWWQVLGIDSNADEGAINTAYRGLAKALHDRGASDAEFSRLNVARDTGKAALNG